MVEGQYLGIPEIAALLQGIGQAAGLRRRDQPVVPIVKNHDPGLQVGDVGAGSEQENYQTGA